jgi:hypothetical protein
MEQRTMSLTATIALSILTLIIGFLAGMLATNPDDPSAVLSQMTEPVEENGESSDESSGSSSSEESVDTSGSRVAFTIQVDKLGESQRNMLKTMGIEGEEIEITYDMLACAEAGIGSDRVEAIKNGGTPSVMEGAQLLACYN